MVPSSSFTCSPIVAPIFALACRKLSDSFSCTQKWFIMLLGYFKCVTQFCACLIDHVLLCASAHTCEDYIFICLSVSGLLGTSSLPHFSLINHFYLKLIKYNFGTVTKHRCLQPLDHLLPMAEVLPPAVIVQ